jgi:hypothetical protein
MKKLILAGLLALGACSTAEVAKAPGSSSQSTAPAPELAADACHAKDMQRLVGRPKTDAPVPVKPDLQRVACTTCAITMDYNPERLNIFFDENTGIIKEVRCG